MELQKLLEPEIEGEWATIETKEGAKLEGKLETSREYTDEQREEIYQNAQYLGKEDIEHSDEKDALEPSEDSYLPNLEPKGDVVTATLNNGFDNYTVEITIFNDTTQVSLETDEGHQRDFEMEDASIEKYEEAINQYSQKIDFKIAEDTKADKRKVKN